MATDVARAARMPGSLGFRVGTPPRGAAAPFLTALLVTVVLLAPAYLSVAMPSPIGAVSAAVFVLILAVLAGDEALRGSPILVLVAAATLLVGQNFFIGLSLNLVADPSETMLLALVELKTVFAIAVLAYVAPHLGAGSRRWRRFALLSAGLVLVALAAGLHGEGSPLARAAYLRNFGTPALYVLLGWSVFARSRLDPGQAWGPLAAGVCAVAVPFSVIHAVLPGVWESLLQLERLEGVKGPISAVGGLPGLLTLPRAGGLIAEGVNASYLFATLTLVLVACRRWTAASAGVLGALLAFGKGGLLLLVAGLAAFGLRRLIWRSGASLRRLATFATVGVAGTVLVLVYVFVPAHSATTGAFGTRSSAETHVVGLMNGLSAAIGQPQGHGLGAGGNFTDIAAGGTDPAVWIASGAESALGVVAFQLGALGLLLLIAQLVSLQGALFRRAADATSDRRLVMAAAISVAMITVLLAFQENALSPQAVGLAFLFAGSLAFPPEHARRSNRLEASGVG